MTLKENIKKIPNTNQQFCIDKTEGKYLVLAGPGTGKTFTIIERIKNMLKRGIKPEKILCLTFTDAAANEMKKRIENELNVISCDVQIFTYHSFCANIIDEFPEEFELNPNYKIITDSISKTFIRECIEEINSFLFLWRFFYGFIHVFLEFAQYINLSILVIADTVFNIACLHI